MHFVNHEGAVDGDKWGAEKGKKGKIEESEMKRPLFRLFSLFLAYMIYLSLWGQEASCEMNERQSVGRR